MVTVTGAMAEAAITAATVTGVTTRVATPEAGAAAVTTTDRNAREPA